MAMIKTMIYVEKPKDLCWHRRVINLKVWDATTKRKLWVFRVEHKTMFNQTPKRSILITKLKI
jgi:hypothetical protein